MEVLMMVSPVCYLVQDRLVCKSDLPTSWNPGKRWLLLLTASLVNG